MVGALALGACAAALWWWRYRDLPFDADHGFFLWPAANRMEPYGANHMDAKPPGIYWLWIALARLRVPVSPRAYRFVVALHVAAIFALLPGFGSVLAALALFLPCLGLVCACTEVFALPYALLASQLPAFGAGLFSGLASLFNVQVGVAALVLSFHPSLEFAGGFALPAAVAAAVLSWRGTLSRLCRTFFLYARHAKRLQFQRFAYLRAPSAVLLALAVCAAPNWRVLLAATVSLAIPLLSRAAQPYYAIPAACLLASACDSSRLPLVFACLVLLAYSFPETTLFRSPHEAAYPGSDYPHRLAEVVRLREAALALLAAAQIPPSRAALLANTDCPQAALGFRATPFHVIAPGFPHERISGFSFGDALKAAMGGAAQAVLVWDHGPLSRFR